MTSPACPTCQSPTHWGDVARTSTVCIKGHRRKTKRKSAIFIMRCTPEWHDYVIEQGGTEFIERLVQRDRRKDV